MRKKINKLFNMQEGAEIKLTNTSKEKPNQSGNLTWESVSTRKKTQKIALTMAQDKYCRSFT